MIEKTVNPEMIALAREARGLTQTELADMLSVSQAMLSKLEAGVKEPSDELVDRLSRALRFPAVFFLQQDPVFGAGLSEFFHRKRQDVPVRVLSRVHAMINISRMHVARLLRSVELPELKIRPYEMAEFEHDPAKVARALRAAWQLQSGPIPNVIRVIEDAGGIVIRFPFGTPKIDAISRWVPGLPPLFFVNQGLPADRERLTLCHELGHLVMHDVPNPNMEDEANAFASEFLMPERDVAPHLDRLTLERLAVLKPYWRVSMAALLMRATRLKKVSDRMQRYLWMEFGRRGWRRAEPAETAIAPEEPGVLQEVIDLHRRQFGFSIDDLAELLAADPLDITSLYGLGRASAEMRSTLRVIKPDGYAAG